MSLQGGYTVHSAVYIETRALITDGIGKYRRVPAFHEGLTRCKRISSVNYEYDFGMTMAPSRFIKCLLYLVDLPHLVLAPLIDFRTTVSSYTRVASRVSGDRLHRQKTCARFTTCDRRLHLLMSRCGVYGCLLVVFDIGTSLRL